jgi:hypothetical protein
MRLGFCIAEPIYARERGIDINTGTTAETTHAGLVGE